MKNLTFALLLIFLFGCATKSEPSTREAHVFNLNGKNYSLTEGLLSYYRDKWKNRPTFIITSVLLNKADVRWSLDYISIMESIHSEGCNSLRIIETRAFDPAIDIDFSGAKIKPGLFDYVWVVGVCDGQRKYRLVHQEGHTSFTLYPLHLKLEESIDERLLLVGSPKLIAVGPEPIEERERRLEAVEVNRQAVFLRFQENPFIYAVHS